MMGIVCQRCDATFDAPSVRGYCPACVTWFKSNERFAHKKANPSPGEHCTGKFNDPEWCPRSVTDEVVQKQVCGLCGSDELEMGYGYMGGYGLGAYQYCHGCKSCLDFSPDTGE